jgi:CRISPR/Cas system-associated exonuclease Cas4 (RecB family)
MTNAHIEEGRASRALSPSQVTTYTDCAARWWYGSAMGLEDPCTGALALGRSVHTGIAEALAGNKNADEAFADAWRVDVAGAELRTDEDAGALEAKGLQLVKLFMDQAAPGLNVEAIEKKITGPIGTAYTRGVIDIRTTDGEVIDIKTASKKPLDISAAHRLQLTTYGMLDHTPKARVITLTKTKEPGLYDHSFQIEPADTQYAATMFSMVADAIQAGIHLPNRGSTLCSRKQCAFWRTCQQDHGGHVRE